MLERSREVKGEDPVLYADYRLGGVVRLVYGAGPEGDMRVPEEVQRSVCFLCTEIGGETRYIGTAFFVGIPSTVSDELIHTYLVSAAHCITKIESLGGDVYVRLNQISGGASLVKVQREWHYPDSGADMAVVPFRPPENKFDYLVTHIESFVTDEVLRAHGIGIGDDLLIAGLFSMRHGRQRNCPIVRQGVLAAMPDEPLEDRRTGSYYDAYLVEVRSIGGLSGSPVFVIIQVGAPRARPSLYLLGIIRGHWDVKREVAALTLGDLDLDQVNMGIAVVVPIKEAATVISSEVFAKERRQREAEWKSAHAPTED